MTLQLEKIINVEELLLQLSPSGALTTIAVNAELDALQGEFDTIEERIERHLAEPSLVERLEDDFARCVPAIVDAVVPLESWAIPLLSALAGPAAPAVSIGCKLACMVAIAVLKNWAAKRNAAAATRTP